jgi:hypothetical protein
LLAACESTCALVRTCAAADALVLDCSLGCDAALAPFRTSAACLDALASFLGCLGGLSCATVESGAAACVTTVPPVLLSCVMLPGSC